MPKPIAPMPPQKPKLGKIVYDPSLKRINWKRLIPAAALLGFATYELAPPSARNPQTQAPTTTEPFPIPRALIIPVPAPTPPAPVAPAPMRPATPAPQAAPAAPAPEAPAPEAPAPEAPVIETATAPTGTKAFVTRHADGRSFVAVQGPTQSLPTVVVSTAQTPTALCAQAVTSPALTDSGMSLYSLAGPAKNRVLCRLPLSKQGQPVAPPEVIVNVDDNVKSVAVVHKAPGQFHAGQVVMDNGNGTKTVFEPNKKQALKTGSADEIARYLDPAKQGIGALKGNLSKSRPAPEPKPY